jgi:hypothetical protein
MSTTTKSNIRTDDNDDRLEAPMAHGF